MKKCPFCAEEIQSEAIVCRFCGREIRPILTPSTFQDHGKTLLIIGGIGVIAGSVLPWGEVTSGFFSKAMYGTNGDGIFTLVLGVFILIAAFGGPGKFLTTLMSLGCTLAAGFLWLNVFTGTLSLVIEDQSTYSIGTGLYILGASIFVSLIGSIAKIRNADPMPARNPPSAQPPIFPQTSKVQQTPMIKTATRNGDTISVVSGIALVFGPILMVLFQSSDLAALFAIASAAGFVGLVATNWPKRAGQH